MHADELNVALTEQYGKPVYHYHMHLVALPVVEKQILWTKRCKDKSLVSTIKEGKRTDLTSDPMGPKLSSAEKISKDSEDSATQIKRYIRLTNLEKSLL